MGLNNYIYIMYGFKFHYNELDNNLLEDIFNNKLPEKLDCVFHHEYENVYVGKMFKYISKYNEFVGDEIITIDIDDHQLIKDVKSELNVNLNTSLMPKWYIIGMIL